MTVAGRTAAGDDRAENRRSPRLRARWQRDEAIRALYGAGISTGEISQLALADVRTFASGKVSVRLRRSIFRRDPAPRYVVLDGRPANQVARHFEACAAADRALPLFAGRVAGAALTRQHVLKVLRAPQNAIDRRDR